MTIWESSIFFVPRNGFEMAPNWRGPAWGAQAATESLRTVVAVAVPPPAPGPVSKRFAAWGVWDVADMGLSWKKMQEGGTPSHQIIHLLMDFP